MLNRIFVVDSVTLTSTGTAVSSYTPWDQTTRKLPTQVVVKATGQGAYVRLSNDASAATNADVLVQGGDHVVLSVQGRRWVSVLSDGASSTVNVGALSTGVSGSAVSLDLPFTGVSTLDSRVTFTRASSATFVGSNGLIQSATTNTPRFDYDPVTLAAKGLLIEEQRTNLLTYSEQFDNTAWVKVASTVTSNAAVAPDGSNTSDALIADTANSQHRVDLTPVSPAGVQTFSVYAKASGYSFIAIRINLVGAVFDLSTGNYASSLNTPVSYSSTSVGNGWYRLTVTVNASANDLVRINVTNNSLNNQFAGDGTSGIFIWGAQLEAGSFATSYIPTVASQVTRSADVASVNTLSPWYNATEGTFYAEFQTLFSGILDITRYVLLADASASKRIIYLAAGQQLAQTFDGTTVINAPGDVTGPVAKVASAYTTSARDIVSNGGTVANGTSVASYPATSLIAISVASNTLCGHIRRITYYPRRLSNAELQAITA